MGVGDVIAQASRSWMRDEVPSGRIRERRVSSGIPPLSGKKLKCNHSMLRAH